MRVIAAAWAIGVVAATGALAFGGSPGRIGEVWHLVAHVGIFGALGAMLARELGPGRSIVAVLVVGAAIEVVQMLGAGHVLAQEASYDMVVDALAGMAGLAIVGRRPVAEALGVWLHPAAVVPIGLVGVFYAALRDLGLAVGWAFVAAACFGPAVATWLIGVWSGRFGDLDLVDRRERPPLFLVGVGSATLFAVAAHASAPDPVVHVADVVLVSALVATALTAAGVKVSGHVGIPLLLALAIAPASSRGPVLFLAAAALLTWARVRAGVHRPTEVALSWGLALAAWPLL